MAVRTPGTSTSGKPVLKRTEEKRTLSLPVMAAAAAIVLVLVIWLAVHALGGRASAQPRPLTANETWLQQKARESSGDFSKLSPPDKQQLLRVAGPQGPMTLRLTYVAMQHNGDIK